MGGSRDRRRREDRLEGIRAVCEGLMMALCSVFSQSDESFCFNFVLFLEEVADVPEQLEACNAQMSYFLRMRRRGGDDLPRE